MGSKSGVDGTLDVTVVGSPVNINVGQVDVNGADGANKATPSNPFPVEIAQGGNVVTVAVLHTTDNQAPGGAAYGILTGGVAQNINAAGNLDRQRETGADGISSVGVSASSTQAAQEFLGSSTTTVTAAAATATLSMANTTGFIVGGTLNFEPVFSGGLPTKYESAVITAVVANTSVAVQFGSAGAKFTHTQPYLVQTFLMNQQRDFSGEGPAMTGIGASLAVDIESNSGGPPLASGLPSGWTLDTDRNIQGKNNAQLVISATTAGDTLLTFTANPWTSGLILGQTIVLSVGANGAAVEQVIVSKNNTPATGAGPITVNIVNPVVTTGSTRATFDVFGLNVPANASPLGTEDCALWAYDPNATDPKRPFNMVQGSGGSLNVNLRNGGTQVTSSSGDVANTAAVATLAGAAGKTTYIAGMSIGGQGATAGTNVQLALSGILGGTLNWNVVVPTGAANVITARDIIFNPPLAASGANTAIVLTLPAAGAGNIHAYASAWGFQQ